MSLPALRLKVGVYFFGYTGNSGGSSLHTDVMDWWVETKAKAEKDPRVSEIYYHIQSDTPITLCRNQCVLHARQQGAHVLIMIDSDQNPQLHKRESWYKPFWDVAFTEIYDHYGKGPLVMCAPYVGAPAAGENTFIFAWRNMGLRGDETIISLEQFTREHAAQMRGVHEVAAGPTGLIMFDMRMFDLLEPVHMPRGDVLDKFRAGEMSREDALAALNEGWFRYEWANNYAAEKASTEDVQCLRDMSMIGQLKLGYNPLRCTFDSWIGHWKPWCCGKPLAWDVDQISGTFQRAVMNHNKTNEGIVESANVVKSDYWDRYTKEHGVSEALPTEDKLLSDLTADEKAAVIKEYDHHTAPEHLGALANLICDEALKREYGFLHVLEIGSWKGDSAIAMAKSNPRVMVTCVDTWKGSASDKTGGLAQIHDVFSEFLNNVQNAGDDVAVRVKYHRMTSMEAAENVCKGLSFDVIFIDADHTYEATKEDIELWYPHVMPGGLLIGHDYGASIFPGVVKAVTEKFGLQVSDFNESPGYHSVYAFSMNNAGFWVVRKPKAVQS